MGGLYEQLYCEYNNDNKMSKEKLRLTITEALFILSQLKIL